MQKVCESNQVLVRPTKVLLKQPGDRWKKQVLIFLIDKDIDRDLAKFLVKKFRSYAHVNKKDHIYLMGPSELQEEASEAVNAA